MEKEETKTNNKADQSTSQGFSFCPRSAIQLQVIWLMLFVISSATGFVQAVVSENLKYRKYKTIIFLENHYA